MNTARTTAETHSEAPSSRWDVLFNWLAVLMLLAGSVVWSR